MSKHRNRRNSGRAEKRRANARYMLGMLPPVGEKLKSNPTMLKLRMEFEAALRSEIEEPSPREVAINKNGKCRFRY